MSQKLHAPAEGPSSQRSADLVIDLPAEPIGRATGIGSWPGDDALLASRTVFDALGTSPHLPYLSELPARGPGADLIGRGAVLLVDMPVDLQPSGWRLVDHAGRDLRRARSWLTQDLDVLAEVADGYSGPLKVQVTGPWTLAASLILPRLERAVVDPGACRDLVESLAEGVIQHLTEIAGLVPSAELVLQIDEPSLPSVLGGSLPTASGFGRLRAVAAPVVIEALTQVLEAATSAGAVTTVLHCCARSTPIAMLAATGASAVAVDVSLLDTPRWDQVAEMSESGTRLWAGVIPSVLPSVLPPQGDPARRPGALAEGLADAIWKPWRQLGLDAAAAGQIVITPACGLAGATRPDAETALKLAMEVAGVMAERSQS